MTTDWAQIAEERERELANREALAKQIEEKVSGIEKAKKDLSLKVQDLVIACDSLNTLLRRHSTDTTTSLYLSYLNLHKRAAGVFNQALTRAKVADRILLAAKTEAEEEKKDQQIATQRIEEKRGLARVQHLLQPTANDFDELYGQPYREVTDG